MFLIEMAFYCLMATAAIPVLLAYLFCWIVDGAVLACQSVVYGTRWALFGKPKNPRAGFWVWYNTLVVPLSRFSNWLSLRSKQVKMRFRRR